MREQLQKPFIKLMPATMMCVLAACGSTSKEIPDAAVVTPDAAVVACGSVTGAGTQHTSTISQPETWTAAASPHVIPADLAIAATVTIDACAVVELGPAVTVTASTGGSIVAQGTVDQRVIFQPLDSTKPWSQLRTVGGTLSFTYTLLDGGGALGNKLPDIAATLDLRAEGTPTEVLLADHLEIRDSASQGIYMVAGGEIAAASNELVITGAHHYPIHAAANVAGSIPAGMYTGNTIDEIDLEGDGQSSIDHDVTLHQRGVPYHVGDPQHTAKLAVAGNSAGQAHLTIEPNVTLRFEAGGAVLVQVAQTDTPATGILTAIGTAGAPIVFTSAATPPEPGDWLGVYFNGIPDPASALDYVTIAYAGGTSSIGGASCRYAGMPPPTNDAALRVFGEPATAFVQHTTIANSAANGVDRGWNGDTSVSFLGGGNQLTGVARCLETYPTPMGAPCPLVVPCPM